MPPRYQERGSWRTVDAVLAVGALAFAGIAVLRAPRWTVDDAFIVARYADNLAHAGRLAWNLDGAPVEGFTSLASVLIAALASRVGIGSVVALTALGVLGFLASVPIIWALARELRAPAPTGGVVCLLYVVLPEHVTHALSGLETELYLAGALACVWLLARALGSPRASALPLALAGFFAFTVRPEGAALAIIALASTALARRGVRRREVLRAALRGFALPVALVEVGRLAVFGDLVPNTFYAKRAEWNGAHMRDLASLVDAFVLDVLFATSAVVAAAWLVGAARPRWPSSRERQLLGAGAVAVALHAAAYARSAPLMDYGLRFAMHSAPWLVVVVVLSMGRTIGAIAEGGRRETARLSWSLGAVLAVAIGAQASRSLASGANERQRVMNYASSVVVLYEPIAAWVDAHLAPDATIAVYPDAGLVPYRSRRRAIDFGKLNDRYLARHSRPEEVAAYFFRERPDALVVSEPRPGALWDEGAERIVHDPRFAEAYERAARFASGSVALSVFTRR